METQVSKSPHPLIWVAAIAVIVFCGAGVAAVMGWIPTSLGQPEPSIGKLDTPIAAPTRAPSARIVSAPEEKVWRDRKSLAPAAAAPVAAARCAECGVVQGVREVEAKGEGSGIGVVGGAAVGGVLGNQVGHGDGRTIATVLGAVGGAVAGNEIEKRVQTKKSYEVTVRFEDGSSRVFTEASAPTWRSGDKVKVVNGVIQSNA